MDWTETRIEALRDEDIARILSDDPLSKVERRRILEAMMTSEERELRRCIQELLDAEPPVSD